MNTIKEIEDALVLLTESPAHADILREYYRLLCIMDNVDGDEVISLVLLAYHNVLMRKGEQR